MTYTQNNSYKNSCECEFTFPIKLNIPITIDTEVCIHPVPVSHQVLPVFIQPDLILKPEVKAKEPVCHQSECDAKELPYQSAEMLPASN